MFHTAPLCHPAGSIKKISKEERMEEIRENKMGTMPVGKLLVSMAAPMIASMLFQALYNIVDSIFVSRVSQDALNAVSLSFPMQMLVIGVSTGTGVGMNALISRYLGEKNKEKADMTANTGIFLFLCSAVFFALLGSMSVEDFAAMINKQVEDERNKR